VAGSGVAFFRFVSSKENFPEYSSSARRRPFRRSAVRLITIHVGEKRDEGFTKIFASSANSSTGFDTEFIIALERSRRDGEKKSEREVRHGSFAQPQADVMISDGNYVTQCHHR